MGWVLFGSFFILLLVGVPVGLAVGLAALIIFLISGIPLQMVPQTFFEGSSSYALVAVPFFILAGDILARGGISERILAIAEATIGRVRGGLAIVATLASMFIAQACNIQLSAGQIAAIVVVPLVLNMRCASVTGLEKRSASLNPSVEMPGIARHEETASGAMPLRSQSFR